MRLVTRFDELLGSNAPWWWDSSSQLLIFHPCCRSLPSVSRSFLSTSSSQRNMTQCLLFNTRFKDKNVSLLQLICSEHERAEEKRL